MKVLFSHCATLPRRLLNIQPVEIKRYLQSLPTCSREIFALEPYTGLRDLPHSKQNALCRGVINPQNGHILCNRTSVRFGTRIADTLLNSRAMKAKRLRTRLRN